MFEATPMRGGRPAQDAQDQREAQNDVRDILPARHAKERRSGQRHKRDASEKPSQSNQAHALGSDIDRVANDDGVIGKLGERP
jgi:hypothetical protein